jgi:hypothetical protein
MQASNREAMPSIYYSAAWTECGCLISCWHEHETVVEAASCIPCAGGYVVAVEDGAMRSLTAAEESEFQCAVLGDSTDNPAAEPAPAASRESVPPRGEGETLLEFVLRLLSAHGFPQHAEPVPDVKHGLIITDVIDSVLSRLSESETSELERMYAEDEHSLLEALGNRFRAVFKLPRGRR